MSLAHIYREEEHLGTYPLEVLPQLVDAGRLDVSDHWFVEGMTAPLPVGDLLKTKAGTQEVRVMNFPRQDVAAMNISEAVKDRAEAYIKKCWPTGCPPLQAIEVKLAFYAGMMAHHELALLIVSHAPETAEIELEQAITAIIERGTRLNEERRDLKP